MRSQVSAAAGAYAKLTPVDLIHWLGEAAVDSDDITVADPVQSWLQDRFPEVDIDVTTHTVRITDKEGLIVSIVPIHAWHDRFIAMVVARWRLDPTMERPAVNIIEAMTLLAPKKPSMLDWFRQFFRR